MARTRRIPFLLSHALAGHDLDRVTTCFASLGYQILRSARWQHKRRIGADFWQSGPGGTPWPPPHGSPNRARACAERPAARMQTRVLLRPPLRYAPPPAAISATYCLPSRPMYVIGLVCALASRRASHSSLPAFESNARNLRIIRRPDRDETARGRYVPPRFNDPVRAPRSLSGPRFSPAAIATQCPPTPVDGDHLPKRRILARYPCLGIPEPRIAPVCRSPPVPRTPLLHVPPLRDVHHVYKQETKRRIHRHPAPVPSAQRARIKSAFPSSGSGVYGPPIFI